MLTQDNTVQDHAGFERRIPLFERSTIISTLDRATAVIGSCLTSEQVSCKVRSHYTLWHGHSASWIFDARTHARTFTNTQTRTNPRSSLGSATGNESANINMEGGRCCVGVCS